MTYEIINIPGGSTTYDDSPIVTVHGGGDYPLTLVVTYKAGMISDGKPGPRGEITFSSVLEYRWVEDFVEYFPYEDDENMKFGLIQITDSKQVEDMASKGPHRDWPGERFGEVIAETDVKHFRLCFDEYGMFDVIALGVSVREIES